MNTNFLFAGIGGQGTLLIADLVALTGLELGLDVKTSEIHGVAQRGGSVCCQVRWGERLRSPLIMPGEGDFLLALERLEALRHLGLLRPRAIVLVDDRRVPPASMTDGAGAYPTAEDEERAYGAVRHSRIAATRIAQELGSARVSNTVMLGALSAYLEVPEHVWRRVVAMRVPEPLVALNWSAFSAGRSAALSLVRVVEGTTELSLSTMAPAPVAAVPDGVN